jgi:type IV pilus assembly protein PilX
MIALTLLGLTTMKTTILEEKMARNSSDLNLSFQAAEAAIRDAEARIDAGGLPTFDGNTVGFYPINSTGTQQYEVDGWDWSTGSIIYPSTSSETIEKVSSQPRYYIEKVDVAGSALNESLVVGFGNNSSFYSFYRITALGTGLTDSAQTILQTYYRP